MMLAAVLALALAAPGSPGRGDAILEEVVAIVRSPPSAAARIVTRTKLVEQARIALVSRGATAAATGPLDRAALRAALEWLLDQMLVADEAARLRVDEVDHAEVLAELRRFQGRFATLAQYKGFLEATELSEDELVATLGRMVRVQHYVQSRVGRAARVGEDDVDRWLRDRGARAAPAVARDQARAQIAEERAAAQVRELLADLRSRADIRIVGSLREGEGP